MLMMNLAPRRLLRGAKRQGIIDHQVNDFLLHDLQYQSDKLSRQPQPGPAPLDHSIFILNNWLRLFFVPILNRLNGRDVPDVFLRDMVVVDFLILVQRLL